MSNKMLNIGGDKNDLNYRYKMSSLQTKIEGRGNGIKTVLMNISDVARQLHTEAPYATKFFGMEVGALSQYDHRRNVGIVHGVHQTKELQKMLDKFIIEFILCPKCKLPELVYKVHQKKNVLLQKCASCGWKGSNSSGHKVKTYIINHPPQPKNKNKNKNSKNTKNVGGKNMKGRKPGNKPGNKPGKPNPNKPSKPGKTKGKGGKGGGSNASASTVDTDYKELGWDNDEVWTVDASDDAVAKRKQKEMDRRANSIQKTVKNVNKNQKTVASTNNDNQNQNNPDNSPAQILRNYVSGGDKTYLEIMDEIKRISLARNFDAKKKTQLAIESLCKLNTLDSFTESIKKYKVILRQFTQNSTDCQIFFGVLEEFVCKRNPDAFLKRVYKILECLYDEDIVNEDDMILWADAPTDKALLVDKDDAEQIRKMAEPFIKWLKQNDDSSGTDDDDDNVANVAVSNT